MLRFVLVFFALLCISAAVFISRVLDEFDRINCIRGRVECRFLSLNKSKTAHTSFVPSIRSTWTHNQVASVSSHIDKTTRNTVNEIGFIEEYGLLMANVPSSNLVGIFANFKLHSSYVILSKLIPHEDQWFTKDFYYQRDVW